MSEQSAQRAAQQKARAALPAVHSEPACGSQQIVSAEQGVAVSNPWAAGPEEIDSQTSWVGVAQCVEQARAALSQKSSDLLSDDVNKVSPISEDMLHKSWKRNLDNGLTWAKLLESFNAESQQFAEPNEHTPVFPKRVEYQGHCGCYCRFRNPFDHVAFFSKLIAEFTAVVRHFGNISVACKRDVLLQCDVSYDTDLVKSIFTWMVAPSAASGAHAAEQTFVLCSPSERSASGQFDTLPAGKSEVDFASLVDIGPLRQLGSDQFAKYVITLQQDTFEDHFPTEVLIRRLTFENVNLSTVLVTGFDCDFQPRRVKVRVDIDEPTAPLDDESGHEDEVPDSEQPSLPVDDLLSMVCECEVPSKKRPKPQRKDKKPSDLKARCWQSKRGEKHSSIYVLDEEEFPSLNPKLIDAVGDAAVAASLDDESASDILEAVRRCEQQHSSRVDSACAFDLDPDPEPQADEVFAANDCPQEACSSSGSAVQHEPPTQMSEHEPVQPAPSSGHASSSRPSNVDVSVQVNCVLSGDGKPLQITTYKKPKFGNLLCEVRQQHPPKSITTAVGRITLMVTQSRESYKAHCSIHKHCQCFVSGVGSAKLDRLVDWLSCAPDCAPDMHAQLSKELRQSFGMKVHS